MLSFGGHTQSCFDGYDFRHRAGQMHNYIQFEVHWWDGGEAQSQNVACNI